MKPRALGYLGVNAKSLADWADYATRLAGMQIADKAGGSMALRMDDRKQRLVIEENGGDGVAYFGWEMDDAVALGAFCATLDKAGVKAERGSSALADQRRVKDLVVVTDPIGYRLEFFHGAEVSDRPFTGGRVHSGFRTGPLGLGHVVATAERVADAVPFYRDLMGFGLSDYYYKPFEAYFFHVNERHHSFALIETGKRSIHHMMIEHFSLDDVGQGLDLALKEEGRLAVTLGRHCGDYMTSYYTHTPSGFMTEHGWGGQLIDVANWTPNHRMEGPSLWGHERSWMTPEGKVAARDLCIENANNGLRRPVQVMEGNYNLMPGACPWWDGVQGKQR